MGDDHNLQRFLSAQELCLDAVMRELRDGRKRSHWMWHVFPQIQGLGWSSTSVFYAIRDIDEAAAYLAHPTLGQRLVACTEAVNAHTKRTAERIFGYPDYLKFRSCMTLFEKTSRQGHPFTDAIEQFFDGERDARTLRILAELSKTRQG